MTARDDAIYLGYMLDTARRAQHLVEGKDRAAYDADEALRLALLHLIQTIGEAARHMSAETREAYPVIPWHQIVGMRHKLVHDYMRVDEDAVWRVASQQIPSLVYELEKIVPAEPPT